MSKNKLVVPEAQQAINNLKMEIAKDLGFPSINNGSSEMYQQLLTVSV